MVKFVCMPPQNTHPASWVYKDQICLMAAGLSENTVPVTDILDSLLIHRRLPKTDPHLLLAYD